MFAVGCVQVITGEDHGKAYRGYKTARGALSRLKEHDGVEVIATKQLGAPKPLKQAKRGDVVSFYAGEEIALGLSLGDKIVGIGEDGLIFMPFSQGIKAWSV